MYRVLIVDDEPVIRNGIHAFIDWEKEGMSAADDCSNGAEAMAVLQSRSVDILITDIKMPLMNGIELMEQALELQPGIKVILISSYNDFDYVREGLKLGAVDYLMKHTLEPENLQAVLKRCVSMLQEERRKESELNRYYEGAIYRERKSLEQEIKRLIVEKQASLLSSFRAPAWMEHEYTCVYLMLDVTEEWRENHGYLYGQLLLEEVQEMFYSQVEEGAALLAGESSIFFVFPANDGETERLLLEWRQSLKTKSALTASVGYTIERGSGNILKGYAGSRSASGRRFFEGFGGLYGTVESEESNAKTIEDTKEQQDWTPFFEIIRNGDPVSLAVDFALERWRSGVSDSEQVKQQACELLSGVYDLQAEAGSLLPEQIDLLRRAETLDQLASQLLCQLEEIGKPLLPKLTDNGYGGELIANALEYMAHHYTENLTLQSVADIVHLSKSYFSLLFKKQTGRNFIDYLIELRIREAKRLLAENDSRVYDVAAGAGFNNVKYFSKLFKKETGLTPLEYREKHQLTELQIN